MAKVILETRVFCQVCCEEKHPKSVFEHEGRRVTSCLEIVHADLCGPEMVPPMEMNSIGGPRIFW